MITENYIKMCKKAKEIQKACKFEKGDWLKIHNLIDETFSLTVLSGGSNKEFITEYLQGFEHIWLPTLEQLFEMAYNKRDKEAYYKSKEYEIMADFIDWLLNSDIDKYKDFSLDFDDTKSCLLIYLMEEFYNKIWTSEKWVKAND